MKVKLCKSIEWGFTAVFKDEHTVESYVAISHPVEVDFVMLEKADYAAQAMACFEAQEKAVNLKYAEEMAAIDRRRQEFMAIPHDSKC